MKRNFVILLISYIIGISIISLAQDGSQELDIFNTINGQKLSATVYLDTINKLINDQYTRGITYHKDSLINRLSKYKDLAWERGVDRKYRAIYYDLLANNARMQFKAGESIFFFEKMEQELKASGTPIPRKVLMQQCYLLAHNQSFQEVVNLFEPELGYFVGLPNQIKKGTVKGTEITNAFYILSPVSSSYIFLKDTSNVEQIKNIIYNCRNTINENSELSLEGKSIIDFLVTSMDFLYYRYLVEDKVGTFQTLNQLQNLSQSPSLSEEWKSVCEINHTEWALESYLHFGLADSASVYLEKFENSVNFLSTNEFRAKRNTFQLLLWGLNQNNQIFNELLLEIVQEKDTIINQITTQLNDLMYAYTKAEYTELELKKAESAKIKRNILFGASFAATVIIAFLLFLKMRNRARKIQAKIGLMNRLTNLKIAELEESKHQAVKEEQERMAQELHDNLATRIMSVKHNIESLGKETTDKRVVKNLNELELQLQEIYSAARNQSHQWFYDKMYHQEKSFTDSIKFLVDSTLPDNRYTKEIDVETNIIALINFDYRINIIRIIQEALTNIIKHANATEVSLFLFGTASDIVLQISNNGVGKTSNLSGMGLYSIAQRVAKMKGKLETTLEDNFTLSIYIPKQPDLI